MERENIYYRILSRGEDLSETFPELGQTYVMAVRRLRDIKPYQYDSTDTEEAMIQVQFVDQMSHYAHIKGDVHIGDQQFIVGDAKFETNRHYPVDQPIGELKVQMS